MTRLASLLWCPVLALVITLGGGSTFATQELSFGQTLTKIQPSLMHNGQLQHGNENEQSLLKKMLSPKQTGWKIDDTVDGLASSDITPHHVSIG